MNRITISSPQDAVPIDRQKIRATAHVVLTGESVEGAEISVAFVDNATIHQLNKRSEEHTSELQSRGHLVCRLLLEKKKRKTRLFDEALQILAVVLRPINRFFLFSRCA